MWSVWDKQSAINGFSAEDFLARTKHLMGEETIYIKTIDGQVVRAEGKNILADNYGIDPTLPDDEFIARYEWLLEHPEEIPNKIPGETPEEEETDTTTYAELAQVYKEGVNGLE